MQGSNRETSSLHYSLLISDAFKPDSDWHPQCQRGSRLGCVSVSDYSNGRVGIPTRYREFSIEDECMWDPVDGQSFGEYYAEQFPMVRKQSWRWTVNMPGVVWLRLFWTPNASDLIALGVNEDLVHYSDYCHPIAHVTPAQATEELMLYQSNLTEQMQYRYIEYKYELEDRFPICGVGMADNPGSEQTTKTGNEPSNEGGWTILRWLHCKQLVNTGCGGCSSGGGITLGTWLLGLWGVRRRIKA